MEHQFVSEFDLNPSVEVLQQMKYLDTLQKSYRTIGKITFERAYLKTFSVWKYLVRSAILKAKGLIIQSHLDGHCFTVKFPEHCTVKYLSISVPHDCNYSLSLETCIQTALLDDTKNLFYDDNLGYIDVCRFCCPEEVEQELIRLCEFKKQ